MTTAAKSKRKKKLTAKQVATLPPVKRMTLAKLKPHPRNEFIRKHPEQGTDEWDTLKASLQDSYFDPILWNKRNGFLVSGHLRTKIFSEMGVIEADAIVVDWPEDKHLARMIAANKPTGEDHAGGLADLLLELDQGNLQMALTGFTGDGVRELIHRLDDPPISKDTAPATPTNPRSKIGMVYHLGRHRVMCGDSTSLEDMKRLMSGAKAHLLHADPPYGMGKEADGVANDNLHAAKLDEFQMSWWGVAGPFLLPNASAYIWGTAVDLWRLWYVGGLSEVPDITLRNEIVWDKISGSGMNSEIHHQYCTATERCLFVMLGQQFLGNVNKEDYWEGYEPIRKYMVAERDKTGWTPAEINAMTGSQMAGHWFGKSQFQVISDRHYQCLKDNAGGRAFAKSHEAVINLLDRDGRKKHGSKLQDHIKEKRSWFDNLHDNMTDVWQYSRVVGEERYGHSIPKPVDMIARAVKSSCPAGGITIEPFGGSGSTLIACEQTGRVCRTMEIERAYVDVIIERYAAFTKSSADKIFKTGKPT